MLHIYSTAEELNTGLANWITELINHSLEVKEYFTLALSGGGTPKKLYETLASLPYREKIKWERLHIFWGDERMVPFEDEQNNARMAYDTLLSKVHIPEAQIHRIWTDITPEDSAKHYEKNSSAILRKQIYFFDLVLLGIGEDGHTLSLFPGSEILNDQRSWVNAVRTKDRGERITLMPSFVNRSAAVIFLVTGKAKARIVQQILENRDSTFFPAQLINPSNNQLHWFLDNEAADNAAAP